MITILCKDGTVTTLPSSLVSSTRYIGPLFEGDDMDSSIRSKLDRSSYMSSIFLPTVEEQGLCLGVGLFSICATNGIDATRRFNVLGFCQSIDAVAESVESTVVSRGGEIWDVKREVSIKKRKHQHQFESIGLPFRSPSLEPWSHSTGNETESMLSFIAVVAKHLQVGKNCHYTRQ